MQAADLLDPRVLFVTGKGGVGKSTAAAAVALAGARSGRRTCLVEVEGRQTMSRLFETQPWDFDEREFRPDLFGMSIDPEASLTEYLEMFYGARRLSKLVVGSTAVEFATTAAPGIKDVLLIGKVKELERRRDPDGRFHYDLVVVDAPPTGRIVNFLRAPDATTELVNVGPIRNQAQSLVDMVLDPERTHLQLVTLLEEMPVEETVQSVGALRELGVTVGPLLVNRVLQPKGDDSVQKLLAAGLDGGELTTMLNGAGLPVSDDTVADLLARGERHAHRIALQERMREQLVRRSEVPMLELPFLSTRAFGEAEVGRLAEEIAEVVT
ncbi:ArsA family ATPase [Egibacter rhizosphaerae]|uniref:ArsA family ATPase n=1 Tax=Egibacter rhizosphaerae TaxID=1670831 RepID=A0A411YE47_9ACTN|nr:ArsA-related P-loop ATPase [Egibacter rhizosphaerae]QBI19450.1 ArsA family ATPase [Egibacter rhizosphaerae]